MDYIEKIIKKAIKNNRKIKMEEISVLKLNDDDFSKLLLGLKKNNITIYQDDFDEYEDINNYEDSYKLYINDIQKYPLLTFDEEIELINKMNQGDEEARQKMILSNLRLVVSIANRFTNNITNNKSNRLDVIENGNLGLIKALSKFDVSMGCKFSTYATWWIINYIQRGNTNLIYPYHISPHIVNKVKAISKYELNFMTTHSREATLNEIAQKFKTSVANIAFLKQMQKPTLSLDSSNNEEERVNPTLYMQISSDDSIEDVIDRVSTENTISNIKKIMNLNLSENQKKVIKLRYGLEDGKYRPLEEVGKLLNLSRERVRQLESTALQTIRKNINSDGSEKIRKYKKF